MSAVSLFLWLIVALMAFRMFSNLCRLALNRDPYSSKNKEPFDDVVWVMSRAVLLIWAGWLLAHGA